MTRPARRALAQRLVQPPHTKSMITGTVTAIDKAQALVTVRPYEGAPTEALLTVPYLAHHAPVVGEIVCLSWVGGNALMCIGPYAPPSRYGPPRIRVERNANQSIPTGTDTYVTWTTAAYQSPGMWDGTSEMITAPLSGIYLLTAHVAFQSANPAAGIRFIAFVTGASATLSGCTIPTSASVNGFQVNVGHTHERYLAAGERVRLRAFHNQGAALNLGWGIFTMRWIAPPP